MKTLADLIAIGTVIVCFIGLVKVTDEATRYFATTNPVPKENKERKLSPKKELKVYDPQYLAGLKNF